MENTCDILVFLFYRIVIASANLTEACCYIELKMDEKAKQLTREVLISCESPEDYIGRMRV